MGVAVAFTSSQIETRCCKSAGVAVAFTRFVDSMGALLGRVGENSTHQFGCSSEDMRIHGWDFGFSQMV